VITLNNIKYSAQLEHLGSSATGAFLNVANFCDSADSPAHAGQFEQEFINDFDKISQAWL